MVLFAAGTLAPGKFLNIWNLSELKEVHATSDHMILGALATYTRVQENEILQSEFPMLCQAAFETGGIATQNRGTLGGNIANASPAADSCPPLLAYDAELELVSARGSRWAPYRNFHTGYKKTIMRPDEIIARIWVPRKSRSGRGEERESVGIIQPSRDGKGADTESGGVGLEEGGSGRAGERESGRGINAGAPTGVRRWTAIGAYQHRVFHTSGNWTHYFRKVGTRKAQAISKVCFSALAQMESGTIGDIRIAIGSVAPTVIRCPRTESVLKDQEISRDAIVAARETLSEEIAPIDDIRSTAGYRKRVAANLLQEFLTGLA
jgi:CO/xanthine dehydrogenase FAD-binding subunit